MGILTAFKKIGITISIIMILLGLTFIIFPGIVTLLLDWVIGCAILVIGVTGVIRIVTDKVNSENKVVRLIPSILCIILSLYLIVFPISTLYMFGIVIGIMAIFAAIGQFSNASIAKKASMKSSYFVLMGIVNLLFALAMFASSYMMVSFLIIFIGCYLIVFGIMFLFSSITLKSPKDKAGNVEVEIIESKPMNSEFADKNIIDAEVVEEDHK